ncbi:MAG: hypothetical protein AB4040_14460 [Synechococcus sp.]
MEGLLVRQRACRTSKVRTVPTIARLEMQIGSLCEANDVGWGRSLGKGNPLRAWLEGDTLLMVHRDDVPQFKRQGGMVRNSYFWALKSIAGYAPRSGEWEFESDVWVALQRMLLSFAASGYLGVRETQLEFPLDGHIPEILRAIATWQESHDEGTGNKRK